MKTLNIGVIGLGTIGQKHCQALAQIERVKIVALADVNESVLSKTAEDFGGTPYQDFNELLRHPGLDAVVVATPDHLHREPCFAAAETGKHILVEKPIATTIKDANAIIEAANIAGVKLMVGFSLRFNLHYLQAKRIVEQGKLGDVISIFARRLNIITQADRIKGRCGVLMFLGIHDFDALRWIVGSEPESIYCEESTSVPKKHPHENETFSIICFENGVRACAHIGWNLPLQHLGGRDFKLDIIGSKGSLYLDQMRQGIEIYSETFSKFPSVSSGLVDEDRSFVDCVLDDLPAPATGKDGIIALRMVVAALESIKTHKPVNI